MAISRHYVTRVMSYGNVASCVDTPTICSVLQVPLRLLTPVPKLMKDSWGSLGYNQDSTSQRSIASHRHGEAEACVNFTSLLGTVGRDPRLIWDGGIARFGVGGKEGLWSPVCVVLVTVNTCQLLGSGVEGEQSHCTDST